jgi:undecaprenyl pyrophosphate phosphatase UppP
MNVNMIEIKNELIGAGFVAGVFLATVLVSYKRGEKEPASVKWTFVIQGTIISFCITYLVLYFLANNVSKEVVDNIIPTEPDF